MGIDMSIFSSGPGKVPDETPGQRKRRISNVVGLALLAGLAGTFGVYKLIVYVNRADELTKTKKVMEIVADGFGRNDPKVVGKWASGQYVDAWGNPIILEAGDTKEFSLLSKGPDGEAGTADDIRASGRRKKEPPKSARTQADKNEPPKEEAKAAEEGPGLIDRGREVIDKGETKGKVGGWNWSLRFGRGEKKE